MEQRVDTGAGNNRQSRIGPDNVVEGFVVNMERFGVGFLLSDARGNKDLGFS
jgi:hypothetical protein